MSLAGRVDRCDAKCARRCRRAAGRGAIAGSSAACGAVPTPIPGGANQVNAVSGALGEPMWNGVVRIKVRELRDARPEDHPETLLPGPDQKVMVFETMLRNGTAAQFAELLTSRSPTRTASRSRSRATM